MWHTCVPDVPHVCQMCHSATHVCQMCHSGTHVCQMCHFATCGTLPQCHMCGTVAHLWHCVCHMCHSDFATCGTVCATCGTGTLPHVCATCATVPHVAHMWHTCVPRVKCLRERDRLSVSGKSRADFRYILVQPREYTFSTVLFCIVRSQLYSDVM